MDYTGVFCDAVIKDGKPICLTATGNSMWPIITSGMTAEIVPLEKCGLPEKGSLLLAKVDNRLVVHRLWGVTTEQGVSMVMLKGDTNLCLDAPITHNNILGRVVSLTKSSATRNPNQGWLYILGRVLCSSMFLSRTWARICRIFLRKERMK